MSWLDKYKWLAYSSVANGGLCKYCMLFPPPGSVSGSIPFTNLVKACGKNGKLETHSQLQYPCCSKPSHRLFTTLRGVFSTISQRASEQYQTNLHVLTTIVRAILFCGRQNISLRGHRDDHTSDSINKGNFIALLNNNLSLIKN